MAAGSLVDYSVTVTSTGPSTARGVIVTGQVPPGMTPIAGSSGGACTVTDGTVTCDLGDLPPGTNLVIPLQARVNSSTPAGLITGTANIGSTTPDPASGNNIQLHDGESHRSHLCGSPDRKVGDAGSAGAGASGRYTVTVTNAGPSDAQNVVITDTLAGVTPAAVTASTGSCTVTGQVVRCTVPSLPAGSATTIGIPVAVDPLATGSIANTAAARRTPATRPRATTGRPSPPPCGRSPTCG